ncbi:hypothetical protein HK098_007607 [Nowakowskiella sp. JEL0407]|nr:hypothetical protein HK098_007607 [Nowakowskiella sp. JEL0407]
MGLLVPYITSVLKTPTTSKRLEDASKTQKVSSFEDVPGPVGYPIVGILPLMIPYFKRKRFDLFFVDFLSKYGSFCKIKSGSTYMLFINDAEFAKKILNNDENYARGPEFLLQFGDFMPHALFILPDGEKWRKHRKGLQPAFGPIHLRDALTATVEISDQLFSIWDKVLKTKRVVTRNIMNDFIALTGDVISRIAFSYDLGAVDSLESNEDLQFSLHLQNLVSAVQKRSALRGREFLWPLFGVSYSQLSHSTNYIRNLVVKAINQKRETLASQPLQESEKWSHDLLDRLLKDDVFSDDEILSEVFGFFFAGHETTANTLAWAVMEIAQHPDCMAKLKKEISDNLAASEEPTYDKLTSFRYLDAFIKETLRLHPVVIFVGKTSQTDNVLSNSENLKIRIPPKTRMVLSIQMLHTNKKYWGESAAEFNPERWIPANGEFIPVPGSYIPFSDGNMNCIGQKLALVEIKVALIRLLRKYSISISKDQGPIIPVTTVTFGLKSGLLIDILAE